MNTQFSRLIVRELHNLGVKYACIGAGSRSTPLTMALSRSQIESISFIDERVAGFFAVGLARITRTPVILVCTSGTALANFFPAILEAKYNNHPLLVLTADRPIKLRDSGANQTMNQHQLYGHSVLAFDEIEPIGEFNAENVNKLISRLHCIVSIAKEIPEGPIHINFPFDKPLQPKSIEEYNRELPIFDYTYKNDSSLIQFFRNHQDNHEKLQEIINDSQAPLFIAGPTSDVNVDYSPLLIAAEKLQTYILADPASGLRFYPNNNRVIAYYESFLSYEKPNFDLLIVVGREPSSNQLLKYLNSDITKIHIDRRKLYDGTLQSTLYICDTIEILSKLHLTAKECPDLLKLEDQVRYKINQLSISTPIIFQNLFDKLSPNSHVYIANSLSIRLIDQFVSKLDKQIYIHHNRGLSGIDGNLSMSAGISYATNKRILVIIGDLSFYHDLNALRIIKQTNLPVTILLFNNFGGGIFERLPISSFDPEYTQFFKTPHNLDFASIVKGFGIRYKLCILNKVVEEVINSYNQPDSIVLEFREDSSVTQSIVQSFLSK